MRVISHSQAVIVGPSSAGLTMSLGIPLPGLKGGTSIQERA